MIHKYKLKGLSRLHNEHHLAATIEPMDKEESIQAAVLGSKEQKESLWNYCKDDWGDKKFALVQCDYVSDSGIPINPTVIGIEL